MTNRRTVLIIDDELDLCLLLKSYFLRKNYNVYLSHTLGEGISFLKQIEPDIIFLDNNLPDGIGWNIAPNLAKDYPNMHINLISAFHPAIPQMPDTTKFTIIEKPVSLIDLDRRLSEIERA